MKPSSSDSLATARSRTASAALELTLAAALWGFGFIAAIWALESLGPLSITGWRLTIATAVGFAIAIAIPSLRKDLSVKQAKLAFWPGVFMSLCLVVQTWALQHTTATKSGFITTLYVLIVPFLEVVWLKRKVPKIHFLFVFLALIGVALICDLPSAIESLLSESKSDLDPLRAKEVWNIGDTATLLAALFAALQIFWFALIREKIGSSFVFNSWQSMWAGAFPLALAFLFEEPMNILDVSGNSLNGLLALTFGSTLIAFALQVKAQKSINPSVASLLFLLESPFAVIFAIVLLGERFTPLSAAGALLIFLALGASVLFSKEANQKKEA